MQRIDLTPLYRTFVGFDRMANMIDTAQRLDNSQSYPPYNIEKIGEDEFRIEIAAAGFSEADLDIETRDGVLIITGKRTEKDDARDYLHRGIAERNFVRQFHLADHVIVNGARLVNGLLQIDLERELPEAKRPRKITINASKSEKAKIANDVSAA